MSYKISSFVFPYGNLNVKNIQIFKIKSNAGLYLVAGKLQNNS